MSSSANYDDLPRSNSEVWLSFGDGGYLFGLPLPQIKELQIKTGNTGIGALYARVTKGCYLDPLTNEVKLDPRLAEFYALDLIETVRHGLIGGGKGMVNGETIKVTPEMATRLIDTYLMGQPMKRAWDLATAILFSCILGYDPPKAEPADERAPEATDEPTATSTTA